MEDNKEYQDIRLLEQDSSKPTLQAVELKFSVPWGHIAAKAWGDPHGEPILAVHGIQDNAATFDTLIPMLLQLVRQPVYVVSVDLPGHGHSSWFSPGIPYRFMDSLGSLRRVVTQLGWHQFTFLGHSLGGLMGYYFSASYPELVKKLIVLDAIVFKKFLGKNGLDFLRKGGEKLLALESKLTKTPPLYTLEEALHRIASSRLTKMTEKGVQALASRNLQAVDGQENVYRFSTDQRMKCLNYPMVIAEDGIQLLKSVKCQLLLVIGSESDTAPEHPVIEAAVNALKNNCSYFKYQVVDGDHDVHLNFPERVAPVVAKFLNEPVCSL